MGTDISKMYKTIYFKIKYRSKSGTDKTRVVLVKKPKNSCVKYPLLIGVHYPIEFDNQTIKNLMKKNFAVMSVYDVGDVHLNNILEDNLFFHIAMFKVARSLSFVDTNNIMLRGGSAGGFILLMLLNIFKNEVRCAFCLHGICNFAYQLEYLQKNKKKNQTGVDAVYENFDETLKFFDYADKSEKLRKYSPIYFKDFYKGPLLIIHSTADAIVPINQWIDIKNDKLLVTQMKDLKLGDDFNISWIDKYEKITETYLIKDLNKPMYKVPFSKKKPYTFLIVDEQDIDESSMHFKNFDFNKIDESGFYLYNICDGDIKI